MLILDVTILDVILVPCSVVKFNMDVMLMDVMLLVYAYKRCLYVRLLNNVVWIALNNSSVLYCC